jgi:hypothetical protein
MYYKTPYCSNLFDSMVKLVSFSLSANQYLRARLMIRTKGRQLALQENTRLEWKRLTVTNTLA